jgi:hypothetical protein
MKLAPLLVLALVAGIPIACSEGGKSAPATTATAEPTATPTPAAEACAEAAVSSPRGDTIFDTLADGAATLGDFHPSFGVEVGDASAGSNSDVTITTALPEDEVNFQAFFMTIPDEWHIVPGCAISLGTTVETVGWLTTLGLLNNPCSNPVAVQFSMRNASTDPTNLMDFVDDDGNLVDGFEKDKDGSGLPDVIERYPDLLDSTFAGRVPLRRAVGISTIAGIPVIAQTLIFSPLDELAGQTLVILFQDFPTARTTISRSPFTDQCAPFSLKLTELGTSPDGIVLERNPAAGTYTFATTAFGLRDADGDGVENNLDTCPFDVNVGNPRVPGNGDADEDGLDAACDPNDLAANADQDGDNTLNRGDLCPLVPGLDRSGAQKDADLDQIADECDIYGKGPDVGDGDVVLSSVGRDVTIH